MSTRARPRIQPIAMLPLAAGFLALSIDRRTAGIILVVVGVARVNLAAFPRAEARFDLGSAAALRAVGHGIGTALFTLAGAIVLIPLGVVGLLRGPRAVLGPQQGWTDASGHVDAPRRPSGGVPPPTDDRIRWSRVVAAASIAVLAVAVVQSADLGGTRRGAQDPAADAMASQPEAEQLQRDELRAFAGMVPDRVRGWKLPEELRTPTVNVRDGARVSTGSVPGAPTVWFFGGSALWGSGQRDGETIASAFAAEAARAGTPVEVVNWGVSGYTTVQETEAFRAALASRAPPDLVVFYDGFNDVEVGAGALLSGLPPGTQMLAPLDVLRRDPIVHRGDGASIRDPGVDDVTGSVLAAYERARIQAQNSAAADGLEVVHVWQPSALTTPGTEALMSRLGYDRRSQADVRSLHAAMVAALPSEIIDLSGSLVGQPDVFVDQVHTNERGARLVAKALYTRLRPRLERLGA